MIIAGIDEAGYGPMLGPLVISAAVFRVDESSAFAEEVRSGKVAAGDLWEPLAPLVVRKRSEGRIPVNDSKKLFTSGKGLRNLEEGLLPFLHRRHERTPESLRELLRLISRRGRGGADDYLEHYPWYAKRDVSIPSDTYASLVRKLSEKLGERLEAAGAEFLGVSAIPVEVTEFNRGLETWENKSRVSFQTIAWFLRRLWRQFASEPAEIVIDRQGGRAHYGRLLFESVRPQGLSIVEESEDTSIYSLTRRARRDAPSGSFRVTFTKESEKSNLPVALASMASKYVRELHMALFNGYWSKHAKDLKPTAGYVQDARRFLKDTEELRARFGVDPALLIRRK